MIGNKIFVLNYEYRDFLFALDGQQLKSECNDILL